MIDEFKFEVTETFAALNLQLKANYEKVNYRILQAMSYTTWFTSSLIVLNER